MAIRISTFLFFSTLFTAQCVVGQVSFKSIGSFSQRKALASENGMSWGYINPKGKWVIEPAFEACQPFSENMAGVRRDRWGFIDLKGVWVIDPLYKEVKPFNEGLAAVKNEKGLWGYIDPQGKWQIEPIYSDAHLFHSGIARVCDRQKGLYGFIDKNGQWLIEPRFILARDFSEGLAFVSMGDQNGWIDVQGKMMIHHPADLYASQIQHQDGFDFSEGKACYKNAGNEKFGYLDKSGRTVIEPRFQGGTKFSKNRALAQEKGYWIIIDEKGKTIFDNRWVRIQMDDSKNELLRVHIVGPESNTDQYGLIDRNGKWAARPQTAIWPMPFAEGLFAVCAASEGTWGFQNRKGKWVIPPGPAQEEEEEGKIMDESGND